MIVGGEIVGARRLGSIRRYKTGAVPRADLETIVDAGRLAATGSNRQPWDFVVVTDRCTIAAFQASAAWIDTAAAVIVVVMDPRSRWWIEDGAAAIENMLLAGTVLGYGSCWVEGNALPHEDMIKSLLGIPADRRLLALLPFDLPAETPSPGKKPLDEVLHWEKFGFFCRVGWPLAPHPPARPLACRGPSRWLALFLNQRQEHRIESRRLCRGPRRPMPLRRTPSPSRGRCAPLAGPRAPRRGAEQCQRSCVTYGSRTQR